MYTKDTFKVIGKESNCISGFFLSHDNIYASWSNWEETAKFVAFCLLSQSTHFDSFNFLFHPFNKSFVWVKTSVYK